jgi:TonB family protein
MSAAAQLAGKELVLRRSRRFPVAVPVDVTMLRSGVPDSIPGRSLDLGEGGLALVLAGELHAGDPVAIEFRLPNLSSAVQAKAVVRHQAQLRCGLEFLSLSDEQQAMIRYWTAATSLPATAGQKIQAPETKPKTADSQHVSRRASIFAMAIIVAILAATAGWWHWRRAWQELESSIGFKEPPAESQFYRASVDSPIRLPVEVVNRLVVHKVEPVYPAQAPKSQLRDVVVLETVIATDGTVAHVRPISGSQALTAAAIDAVKWWRFQPYRVNGRPVRVETTLAIDFNATEN